MSRSKFAFSPFLTYKFTMPPKDFEPKETETELCRFNGERTSALTELFFFPMCLHGQWILVCINYLFQEVNVFDPLNSIPVQIRDGYVSNLVHNFQTACKEADLFDRNFSRYRVLQPRCPKISSVLPSYKHDSGIFVMMFKENWDGQLMKDFDHIVASDFRKLVA